MLWQVLYLPPLGVSDVNEAARDKELVQQLESIVIYWTRQIKEVRGEEGRRWALYGHLGSQGGDSFVCVWSTSLPVHYITHAYLCQPLFLGNIRW